MTATSGESEINGDLRLGAADRVRYLAGNLMRNLRGAFAPATIRYWRYPDSLLRAAALGPASPGRLLSEAFIRHELPKLVPPRPLEVLDIGCGSGRMAKLLAEAGYSGDYTGIDPADRFRAQEWPEASRFRLSFVQGDAHTVLPGSSFDLIVSLSALEHIPDDARLIRRLNGLLAPGGLQIHFVPSTWGLLVYLWHGYRQYGAAAIAERFDRENTTLYKLGGLGSFLVHWSLITMPEYLLRTSFRSKWPRAYDRLLRAGFSLDRAAPFMGSIYAILQPVGPGFDEQRARS